MNDADRAVRRTAFWDEFWEVFASPYTILADFINDLFKPQDKELDEVEFDETPFEDVAPSKTTYTPGFYVARFRARYGEGGSDTDIGSVERAWSKTADRLRRALEQMERDYDEQIRDAKLKETERDV